MHRGIVELGGDLREVQVVFPDHLLALLKLDPADVFAGGNLQVLVEQRREIAGADVHLPGDQRHRQLFPDVSADKLLRLTAELMLVIDSPKLNESLKEDVKTYLESSLYVKQGEQNIKGSNYEENKLSGFKTFVYFFINLFIKYIRHLI